MSTTARRSAGPGRRQEKICIDRDRVCVWVWDEERKESRQLWITRLCALIDGRTGRVITGVDIARWLADPGYVVILS